MYPPMGGPSSYVFDGEYGTFRREHRAGGGRCHIIKRFPDHLLSQGSLIVTRLPPLPRARLSLSVPINLLCAALLLACAANASAQRLVSASHGTSAPVAAPRTCARPDIARFRA